MRQIFSIHGGVAACICTSVAVSYVLCGTVPRMRPCEVGEHWILQALASFRPSLLCGSIPQNGQLFVSGIVHTAALIIDMAEATNNSFPVLPVSHWWALRERFKKSIPNVVNGSYIASVLNMEEASARANVLPSLKYTGIIDDDGNPTDRAIKWRDDSHYREVCEAIRNEVYPQELLDVAHDPANDQDKARRWFANKTGSGQNAVRKMLSVYLLLLDADVSKSTGGAKPSKKATGSREPRKASSARSSRTTNTARIESPGDDKESTVQARRGIEPTLHFDIQIHISPESPPEQIDQIFASMARHLKSLGD